MQTHKMKKILNILLLSLICFTAKSQSPTGLPSPNSPLSYYVVGWLKSDSGVINVLRDTTVRSRYAGLQIFWQNQGVDSNVWYFDGARYFHYPKSTQDIYNLLGGVPVTQLTTTGASGTPATLANGILNIPTPTGGGGGGGNIVSINTLTNPNLFIITGSTGSDFNINSTGANITINLPTASAGVRGLLTSGDWSTFNTKQPQLNGTGFVKATGTTISYDNSTYYLASNPSSFITRTGISANAPILYNNSSGVISADTSTGLTHLATQAYVLANQASGTITGAGNLVPIFTTSTSGSTLLFALTNAAGNTALVNNSSSSGAPSYAKVANATLQNSTITFSSTDLSGSGSIALGGTLTSNINNNAVTFAKMQQAAPNSLWGNPAGSTANVSSITLGYGLKFIGTTLVLDTANVKDSIFALGGLTIIGATKDSIIWGGTLFQTTHISGSSNFNVSFDSTFLFLTGPGYTTPINSDSTNNKVLVRNTSTGKINEMYWPATGGGGGGGTYIYLPDVAATTGNYTVTTKNFIILPDLTGQANRNAILPTSPTDGTPLEFRNENTVASGFAWTFTNG